MGKVSDHARLAELLAAHPVLCTLGREACAALAASGALQRFLRGQRLDAAPGALLLLDGAARSLSNGGAKLARGSVCFVERLLDPDFDAEGPALEATAPATALRLPAGPLREFPSLRRLVHNLREPAVRALLHELARLVAPAPEPLRALVENLERRDFQSGTVLARKGAQADGFMLVVRGRARRAPVGSDDSPRLLTAGDFFGEAALALGSPEPADVVALDTGSCFVLDRTTFERIALATPGLRALFASLVAALADQGRAVRPARVAPVAAEEDEDEALEEDLLRPAGTRVGRALRRALRRYPVRYQPEATDCGPACLGMVADFYGRPAKHARLRELASVSRQGCSLYSLAEAAEDIGFLARAVAVENATDLRAVRLPAIAHYDTNHFVVIYEVGRRHVLVGDPAVGLRRLPLRPFLEEQERALLLLRPASSAAREREEGRRGAARFLRYLWPHRGVIVEVLLAALALQLLGLVIPFATQTVIDRVFVHGEVSLLMALLGALLGAALFSALIGALRTLLLYDVIRAADQALVSDFHHRLFQLPLRFFASRKVGDLLVRFADNEKVRHFVTTVAIGALLDLALGVVYIAVLLAYDVQLALIGLLPIPALVLVTLVITPRLRRAQREHVARHGETQSALVETLSSIVTVKGACAEQSERQRYEHLFDRLLDVELRAVRLSTYSDALATLITACGQAVVIYWGATLVIEGTLSVGAYIAFAAVLSQVMTPATRLLGVWEEFQDTAVALERLDQVFDASPEEPEPRRLLRLGRLDGHLRLDRVTFRYERDLSPVFDDFSLEVLPGERVAIVGRSGAGKTTFVHLLLKLIEPERGSVLVDGHDLRNVAVRSLRRQVGFVPQKIELFSGTIADNIAVGRDLTPEEIIEAARAAGIHEAITARPHGYGTQVGERATTRFSGGELQRLAIARALAGDPRLLILDEPTSALDSESETAFLNMLEQTGEGRTVLLLAHRLAFARRADRIIVFDQGRVAEQGAHAELVRSGGIYAALHAEQVG